MVFVDRRLSTPRKLFLADDALIRCLFVFLFSRWKLFSFFGRLKLYCLDGFSDGVESADDLSARSSLLKLLICSKACLLSSSFVGNELLIAIGTILPRPLRQAGCRRHASSSSSDR